MDATPTTAKTKVKTAACRAGFITLGALPTLVVACLSIAVHTPAWHRGRCDACAASLSHVLGMNVRVNELAREPGGALRLGDVLVEDPESLAQVASARSATAMHKGGAWVVSIPEMTVRTDLAPRAAALAHEHLLRRWSGRSPATLTVDRLTLDGPGPSQTVTGVRIQWSGSHEKTALRLSATLPGSPDPFTISTVRSRQAVPATTRVRVETRGGVPCSAVAAMFPDIPLLSNAGAFRGTAEWQQSADGWNGELAGEFPAVELDDVVTRFFPHKLSGQARIVIEHAAVAEGRLVQLTGRCTAARGVISRSLVDAAIEHLALRADGPVPDDPLVRFDHLDLRFAIERDRLTLAGAPAAGVVLAAGSMTLAAGSTDLSTLALLRTLVPQRDLAVPVTAETQRLAAFVRLPRSDPQPNANAYVPLRLRE